MPASVAPGVTAYIGLGSNLGDRAAHLCAAVEALGDGEGVAVEACSPVYETPAHTLTPGEAQPAYLNAVARVRTALPAEALLERLLAIEQGRGRERSARWAPRTLDLDLLLYGDATLATGPLTVPHPRLAERRFVLRPLADLAPNLWVPLPFGRTVRALLADCPDADVPVRTPHPLPCLVGASPEAP